MKAIAGIFLYLSLLFLFPSFVDAKVVSQKITDAIPLRPATTKGEIFYNHEFSINYIGGDVWLSSTPDGTGNLLTDDGFEFYSLKPTGMAAVTKRSFSNVCTHLITPLPPINLKVHFLPGENKIRFKLFDECGFEVSSNPYYLVYEQPADPVPTPSPGVAPFLRLPWDYEAEGLTFTEAAMGMSAYLDHEYPLLSTNLSLPSNIPQNTVVTYKGLNRTSLNYDRHDGYDFAKDARAFIGKPVFAAADGIAEYFGSCNACGAAITIDHHNGFQTRYYHLQKESLLTPLDETKIQVKKGQQIGIIGYSGRTIPSGSDGAHLHFMVVQDKNNDGNFEDNIPDGITDPYGWQSTEPDPWENYSFSYNGPRTGNKSYYLWDQKLANLDATLDSNGGVFNTERFKLEFPQNFTNENLKLKMEAQPQVKADNDLVSIGSTIKTTLTDTAGNLKEQFSTFYQMTINHKPDDLVSVDPTTLSIYSSRDGITWIKEDSIIDTLKNEVHAKLNHMTYFALMAKRKDITPPVTEALIEGIEGTDSWYRSDVKITLQAIDNENGLGVDHTFYKLTDQEWKIYKEPIILTNEGNYHIEFYSIDKDENSEITHSKEFNIDKTIPEARITANPDQLSILVTAFDNNQTDIQTESLNGNFQQYNLKDLAGNNLTVTVKYKDNDKKDQIKIEQLTYNDSHPLILQKNNFNFSHKIKHNISKLTAQSFDSEDKNKKREIKLEYNSDKNQTKIEEIIDGKKTKQTVQGLKLLQVNTNKGTLIYSY